MIQLVTINSSTCSTFFRLIYRARAYRPSIRIFVLDRESGANQSPCVLRALCGDSLTDDIIKSFPKKPISSMFLHKFELFIKYDNKYGDEGEGKNRIRQVTQVFETQSTLSSKSQLFAEVA